MIEFKEAINVARENVAKLVGAVDDLRLEEAIISEDGKLYEITFSYYVEDLLEDKTQTPKGAKILNPHLFELARVMGRRRKYKIFLVDAKLGHFRGFRNHKDS